MSEENIEVSPPTKEEMRKLDIANRIVFKILKMQRDFEERARQAEKVKKIQHKLQQEKLKRLGQLGEELSRKDLIVRTFEDPDLQADFEFLLIQRKFLNDNYGMTNEHYDILYQISQQMSYEEFSKNIKPQRTPKAIPIAT